MRINSDYVSYVEKLLKNNATQVYVQFEERKSYIRRDGVRARSFDQNLLAGGGLE